MRGQRHTRRRGLLIKRRLFQNFRFRFLEFLVVLMSICTVVCGAPASGKSTVGRRLSQQQGAVLLDSDVCAERIVRAAWSAMGREQDDFDSPLYKRTFREPIYDTLYDVAAAQPPALSVVLVGPFTRELQDEQWPQWLATRLKREVRVVVVVCSDEVRRHRMEARANPRDAAKLADWQAHAHLYKDPKCPHTVIDNNADNN